LFVITSCNWTDDELLRHFSEKMKLKCVIPTPQFKFGGKVGSVVSSVVFEKL
ncbi:jg9846, partial [Pararge aegeria aegeria]